VAAQAPPRTTAPAAPVSAAIPVAEVATQAAQVPNILRALTEPLAPSAEIELIRKRLPGLREQLELELAAAATILRGRPTLDMIQAQQQLWQRRQLEMTEWLTRLTHRATLLQAALNRLADMAQTWRQTRDASTAAKAPGPILAQIDGALAAIQAAEAPLAAQRTAVLDLQSVVAQEVARSSTVLAQFTEAQQRAMGGILMRDSPPLWAAEAWAEARATLPVRVREVAAAHWNDVVQYIRNPTGGMALHLVIFAVLVAVFLAARRQVRESTATGDGESPAVTVFDRPYAAALIVTLLLVSGPNSSAPPSVRNLCEGLVLVPVIRLTRPVIDSRLVSAVYTLAVLFALDTLRQAFGGVPLLEQAILAVEMLVGIAVLGGSLIAGPLRRAAQVAESDRLRAFRVGAGLVLLALAAGLVAGTVGYMPLGRLLAAGLLGSGALAITLYACVLVALAMAALILRVWPLRLLGMVQHHRDLLERRTQGVLIWLAIGAWALRFLDYVGLFEPAKSLAGTMLAAQLGRGSISFSLGDVLEFVLTVWLAYLLSTFVRFVLREDVYPRTQMTRGISYALSSLLNYAILTLGFLLGLGVLGLDLTKVTILAGAFSVGIGFGLQSVVNNFVSGLILLFERPIHVGDIVEIGDLLGEVVRIGIRASTVRTYRGADIIVPNAQLVTERVTNWTLSDRRRRIDLPVGVDYGSPPEKVVGVLEAVAREHPQILKDPAPQAVFIAFGDSSINFELRAWTNRFERWTTIQTELAVALYAALRAAGMTFPFPQREVRVLNDALAPKPPGRVAEAAR
jgi:small-conductance mechanosensitive channel